MQRSGMMKSRRTVFASSSDLKIFRCKIGLIPCPSVQSSVDKVGDTEYFQDPFLVNWVASFVQHVVEYCFAKELPRSPIPFVNCKVTHHFNQLFDVYICCNRLTMSPEAVIDDNIAGSTKRHY